VILDLLEWVKQRGKETAKKMREQYRNPTRGEKEIRFLVLHNIARPKV